MRDYSCLHKQWYWHVVAGWTSWCLQVKWFSFALHSQTSLDHQQYLVWAGKVPQHFQKSLHIVLQNRKLLKHLILSTCTCPDAFPNMAQLNDGTGAQSSIPPSWKTWSCRCRWVTNLPNFKDSQTSQTNCSPVSWTLMVYSVMSNLSPAHHDLGTHGSVFQKAYTVSNFYLLLSYSCYFCTAVACLLSPTCSTRCATWQSGQLNETGGTRLQPGWCRFSKVTSLSCSARIRQYARYKPSLPFPLLFSSNHVHW